MTVFGYNLLMAGINIDGRKDILIINVLSAGVFFYVTLKEIPRGEPPTK